MSKQAALLLAVVTIVLFSTPLMAQRTSEPSPGGIPIKWTAADILVQVRSKYQHYSQIRLRFTIEIENTNQRNGLRSSVSRGYRATLVSDGGDRSRTEVQGVDFDILRVVDGRLSWYYLPDSGVYAKYEADEKGRHHLLKDREARYHDRIKLATEVLSSYATLDPQLRRPGQSIRLVGEEFLEIGSQRRPCFVIEMVQPSATKAPIIGVDRTQRLWIDRESFVVWRQELIDDTKYTSALNGVEVTRINFQEAVWSENPRPDTFYFEAPTGARLVAKLSPAADPEATPVKVGDPAPDFTLSNLDGQSISLKGLRGKVVLVNFWATWCGPCRVEMPHLEKLYQEYHKQGVAFLTISDEQPETVRQFLKARNYSFGSMVDAQSVVSNLYGVRGIPHTFLVDRSGRVVAGLPGSQKEADLREAIIKGLNAPPAPVRQVFARIAPESRCAPALLSPAAGGLAEVMRSGEDAWWLFRWRGCPDISRFHLQILEPKAPLPLFDYQGLTTLFYRFPLQEKAGKAGSLKGWRWRLRGQSRGEWGEWVEGSFDVEQLRARAEVESTVPIQVSPGHRQVLDYRPRQVEIVWKPVPGAAFYRVEIDLYTNGAWHSQTLGKRSSVIEEAETRARMHLGSAQLARWRVWSVDRQSKEGPKSDWWECTFLR